MKIDAELARDLVVTRLLHHCSSRANMFVGASQLKLATAAVISDRRQQAHACHRRLMPSTPCRLQEAGDSRLLVNWGLAASFLVSANELMLATAADNPILRRQTLRRLKVWGGRLCIPGRPVHGGSTRVCAHATSLWRAADHEQFPGPPVDAMLPLMPYKLSFVCGPLVSEPDSGLSRKFTRVGGMSGQGA